MKGYSLYNLTSAGKLLVFGFLMALSFGYVTGLKFVSDTSGFGPKGIQQNYNGDQIESEALEEEASDEDLMSEDFVDESETLPADDLRFRMTEKQLLNIIHAHTISYALIFLALGFLVLGLNINGTLKKLLIFEPFVSILLTFGGIWLMWLELDWMRYVVFISGIFLSVTFFVSVILVAWHLLYGKRNGPDS